GRAPERAGPEGPPRRWQPHCRLRPPRSVMRPYRAAPPGGVGWDEVPRILAPARQRRACLAHRHAASPRRRSVTEPESAEQDRAAAEPPPPVGAPEPEAADPP